MKNNLVVEKAFAFSLKVIALYKELSGNNEYVLSRQLLRSGTSIGANCEETTAAQTKKRLYNENVYCIKRSQGSKILDPPAESIRIY